jgi:hypothetical protein
VLPNVSPNKLATLLATLLVTLLVTTPYYNLTWRTLRTRTIWTNWRMTTKVLPLAVTLMLHHPR